MLVGGHLDSQVAAKCSAYLLLGDRYDVQTIDYCDDALNALSQQSFDVILLFSIFARWRMLPSRRVRFGGIEFLKQMRALHIHVPTLVVSASMLAQAKNEALANGAAAFIPKPVKLTELEEALVSHSRDPLNDAR